MRQVLEEMIYADGIHGRFRLGYGAQFIHVAAAMAEDRTEIDDLVACGADPNARDAGGCTPSHYAAFIEAALDAGADPAGNGEAFRDAQAKAQFSRPAFAATRAYKRLLLAFGRRD